MHWVQYLRLMRPPQWVKNVVILAGPLFGRKLFEISGAIATLWAFIAFCFVSSAVYVINDVVDRRQDRLHPSKCTRPIASGAVSPASAVLFGIAIFAAACVIGALLLPRVFFVLLLVYYGLMLAYTFVLKQRMLVDVIVIAVGFVLRAMAGAAAVDVRVSPWLIVCTFTLCMFLGFGKRRCELAVIGNDADAGEHRRTLRHYTPALLNQLLNVSAGIAIVTFLLYTMEPDESVPFEKKELIYTIPLVVYGVFRYTMLVEGGVMTGPTDIVINDRPFLATVLLWGVVAAVIINKSLIVEWFR